MGGGESNVNVVFLLNVFSLRLWSQSCALFPIYVFYKTNNYNNHRLEYFTWYLASFNNSCLLNAFTQYYSNFAFHICLTPFFLPAGRMTDESLFENDLEHTFSDLKYLPIPLYSQESAILFPLQALLCCIFLTEKENRKPPPSQFLKLI